MGKTRPVPINDPASRKGQIKDPPPATKREDCPSKGDNRPVKFPSKNRTPQA